MKRHRLGIAQGADQRLMLDQVLQQAMGPGEKVMSRMHPKRGIHHELERFELEGIRYAWAAGGHAVHFGWLTDMWLGLGSVLCNVLVLLVCACLHVNLPDIKGIVLGNMSSLYDTSVNCLK